MTQAEFEKVLSRRVLKRRLIEGALAVAFLTIGVVFHQLWEASAEIVTVPELHYERTVHDDRYIHGIALGFTFGFAMCSVILIDLLLCRFKTVQKGQQYLTVYRGLLLNSVYVNGKERSRILASFHYNVAEVWLAERTRATISFVQSPFYLAHIAFSDDTASMEV